jgi:hypothetical protein
MLSEQEREERRQAHLKKQRAINAAVDKLGAHDLFGQPLEVGDTIAWPTSAGRAVGITVGVVTKITWKDTRNRVSGRMYTVQARPLKAGYSGHYSNKSYTTDKATGKLVVTEKEISPVTIQKVQNIVKVEVPAKQLSMELQ